MLSLFYISFLLHKTLISSNLFLDASQKKNKPMKKSTHNINVKNIKINMCCLLYR